MKKQLTRREVEILTLIKTVYKSYKHISEMHTLTYLLEKLDDYTEIMEAKGTSYGYTYINNMESLVKVVAMTTINAQYGYTRFLRKEYQNPAYHVDNFVSDDMKWIGDEREFEFSV